MKLEAMMEEEIEFDFFLYHSYEQKQLSSQCNYIRDTCCKVCITTIISRIEKESKSKRWMPWLYEAMKDVVSCEKVRVGANDL